MEMTRIIVIIMEETMPAAITRIMAEGTSEAAMVAGEETVGAVVGAAIKRTPPPRR
jgi:hypothetical protein